MDILNKQILGNTVLGFLATLLIILGGIIVIFIVKTFVFSRLSKRADRTKNKFDGLLANLLGKTLIPALYIGVIYLSLFHLHLSEAFKKGINIGSIIIVTFLSIKFLTSVASYAVEHFWLDKILDESRKKSVKSVMPVLKIIIYGLGVFFLLDNLGFKISTLVAGLGIGGVAVALAGQAILGDLFSYFSILFDRPFELGDFIIVDEHMGIVEHIGIKTTRIRSLSGEELIMSNSDLTGSRVKNYKRMVERRVVFSLGVTYQTPAEKLKEIPSIVKTIISGISDARFDRAHFAKCGDFSLNFEIVYYVYGGDYNKYMDINQQINLKIFEEFEKRQIEFAYPTQTLYLNRETS